MRHWKTAAPVVGSVYCVKYSLMGMLYVACRPAALSFMSVVRRCDTPPAGATEEDGGGESR
jgi:hypothetical protein